jgi:cephalosporin-C deacetylase
MLLYSSTSHFRLSRITVLLAMLCLASIARAQDIEAVPSHADGVYTRGDTVSWTITAPEGCQVRAVVKQNDANVLWEGPVAISNGQGMVDASLDVPGMIFTTISTDRQQGRPELFLGAAVDPFRIEPAAPPPDDFDAFWKEKIRRLNSVPYKARLKTAKSGDDRVEYSTLSLRSVNGRSIHGQLAKPAGAGKYPAIVIFQWAGVYGLEKEWVVDWAKKGWLALNIMSHDLPIGGTPDYYQKQTEKVLSNYTAIGNDNRENSYFLSMFLGSYRAADYLTTHPAWDGRTLVVTGASQGGLQSLATAGLHPKVSAMVVQVPAGCDTIAPWAGRSAAWPDWKGNVRGRSEQRVKATSRYFDGANFARNIRCPSLVAIGMLDQRATPSSILAAFNQISAPKEAVMMLNAQHRDRNHSHAKWHERSAVWFRALLKGDPAPVRASSALIDSVPKSVGD